jgi:hypothetical protein
MSSIFRVFFLLLFCLSAHSVNADTVTYTFEPPFFSGQTVPLTDRAPNSGPNTFLADFTSPGMLTGPFRIATVPHAFFVSQSLFNPISPAILTISFNIPVNYVELSFGLAVPGVLTLTSPVGSITQNSSMVGNSHGGILVFSSSTPFTMFQLEGFNLAAVPVPVLFGIDNLTMNVVPEPATILLLSTGLVVIAAKLRKRKNDHK